MSAKKTYLEMVIEAIPIIKDRKGASRMAIANWIQEHCDKVAGSTFNAHLRSALKKGIESGILKEGNTPQRFRIGVLPKAPKPKKKKVSSKKKRVSKKKKTASKKKSSSKKKRAPKKKTVSKKKKAGSRKKGSSKKKKAAPKRRSRK